MRSAPTSNCERVVVRVGARRYRAFARERKGLMAFIAFA